MNFEKSTIMAQKDFFKHKLCPLGFQDLISSKPPGVILHTDSVLQVGCCGILL